MNISVVIPFYNAEDYFPFALESVLAQTFPVSEVIVVNDGCGEKTTSFLNQFEGIKVVVLESNQGPSVARNIGIQAASNDWIAFLDADDVWQTDKLQKQVDYLGKNTSLIACHTGTQVFDGDKVLQTYCDKPEILTLKDLLVSQQVTPPSLLIKKSALEAVGLFDTNIRCSEDHDLSIRLVAANNQIGFVKEPLTRVRRMNHGNVSSSAWRVFKGKMTLLCKHWSLFRLHPGTISLHLYQATMTAGGKAVGLQRVFFFGSGRLLKIIFPSLKEIR